MTSSPPKARAPYHILDVGPASAANNFTYPQVESMGPGYDWSAPNSVTSIIRNRALSVVPNLHAFHLNDATEITDLLSQVSISAAGLLASPNFCDALHDQMVQAHQSYVAEVVHRKRSYPYRWLHFTEAVEDRIDIARSSFFLKRHDGTFAPVPIGDRATFRATVARLANTMGGDLAIGVCAFLPGTPCFDLLTISLPGETFFVSTRLADRLVKRGLTGFEISASRTDMVFAA